MQHEVSQHQLAGGAKLLVINMPNASSFYFGSYVRAGWRFSPRQKLDMPHLIEHLAFEGNESFPNPVDFKFAIEKTGTYTNATTSDQLVWYRFSSIPENLL